MSTDVGTPAQTDREVTERVDAERARLRQQFAARQAVTHFRRPVERPFTAAERDRVTILFGGLTAKHESLIKAVFQGAGYRTEILPTAVVAAFQLGKGYGENGQYSPTYFTVGQLITYLQHLEAAGLSRQQIVDHYVFFTAGSCGPWRGRADEAGDPRAR